MASDYDNGASPSDRYYASTPPADIEEEYQGGPRWANGEGHEGHEGHDHDTDHNNLHSFSGSPAPPAAEWEDQRRPSGDSSRLRNPRAIRPGNGQTRVCKKCGLPMSGQFVRALDGTFHLDCFKCRDCGQIVASKFFPSEDENGEGQYPLCETDYFRRLGLLCYQCGGALRGSYITALERKYHVNHFTCSICPTEFGAQDSYYEHDGQVFCHYHYSTRFAQRCNGCRTAILKQFVEIFRNGQNQHWHPECYMIHKFWNVRLSQADDAAEELESESKGHRNIKEEEERMDDKVYKIWSVLSSFEESSAACISDMLLHVSNGAYVDGITVARRFILHVQILFGAADNLDAYATKVGGKNLTYGREAKLLCKKIVAFFSLVSKAQDTGMRKLGVTQDLLSLVTGLAHYLKLLIRICLQGALRVERDSASSDCVFAFLDDLDKLETIRHDDDAQNLMTNPRLSAKDSDHCALCNKSLEDECAKHGELRWHLGCINCVACGRELGHSLSQARHNAFDSKVYCENCFGMTNDGLIIFEHVTKLQQYVFLLRVAMARLLDRLQRTGALPHTAEDPNLNGYHAADGYRVGDPNIAQHSSTDLQSRTYGDDVAANRRESSYEVTRDEIAKMRNTRLDRSLSTSVKKARMSRIMDRPEGRSVRPGSAGADHGGRGNASMQIVEDQPGDYNTADTMFGNQDALTLDDIPRIVAAEQSKEQFGKPVRQELFRSPATEPSMGSGQWRPSSGGRDAYFGQGGEQSGGQRVGRRFFSELSGLEYFAVRHLAVLTMQPMVESEFTQEELLSFIEQRKQGTFWKNLGKAFGKNNETKKVGKKKGVFGVPLEIILERDGADSTDGVGPGALRIPAVVDNIISAMRKMDLSVEGVFRRNGNIKKLTDLIERINQEGCDNIDFMQQPVVQIADLLKRYLRELPEPLMTNKLYGLWLAAAKIQDHDRRRQCLHLACCLLPKCHRDCLEVLLYFLKWAGTFHQIDEESGSRMDIRNLATVIAPNIMYSTTRTSALDKDPMYVIDAVHELIANIEEMCMVPDYLDNLLGDPLIFGNSGEVTTKEILKRYQELQGQRPYGEVNEMYSNRQDNSTRPPARRVETDPSVWQGETTVRTVQDVSLPPSGPGTPSHRWRANEDGGPRLGYGPPPPQPKQAPPEGQPENGPDAAQKREWRNSGWGRQNSGVSVAGNL